MASSKLPTLLSNPFQIIYYFFIYVFRNTRIILKKYTLQLLLVALFGIVLYYQFAYEMYWVLLGILSSIGFGSGLHTFVLFLAPFIIEKTMIQDNLEITDKLISTFTMIYYETFLWGMGTAIGELPPYFLARISKEYDIGLIIKKKNRSFTEQGQVFIYNVIQRMGFWGILLCASVPNPLFDLAGIMCGKFGIDFYTFFGAVFIGKALIKCMIQVLLI
jgi:membrane protein YqaA with SNARE-associated domain